MPRTLVVVALLLFACGTGPNGGGGEPPSLVIDFPRFDFEVRSQVFVADYLGSEIYPDVYALYLTEEPDACAPDGLTLGIRDRWLALRLVHPAMGDCPLDYAPTAPGEEPLRGCHGSLLLNDDRGWWLPVRAGTVRVDRIDATTMAGEVVLLMNDPRLETRACPLGWVEGATCACEGPDGPYECVLAGPDEATCCPNARPPSRLAFPFEASRCAGNCLTEGCVPDRAASCSPADAPRPTSCEAACDAYLDVCASCTDTVPREGGPCDRMDCLEHCRALVDADPLVSLSLACVETASNCSAWRSCVSACGP